MELKRVVITGMGAITPIGNSVEAFWHNAIKGTNGVGPVTKFDASPFKTRFAAEVKDFAPETALDRSEIRRNDLFTQYACYAASEALMSSGLDLSKISPFDIGVIWGTGQGGMQTFENEVQNYARNKMEPRFNPFFIPKIIANMASGMISIKFGLMGINYTTVSACATSNSAIMDAFNYIRLGKAAAIIAGGSEAPITEASFGGFTSMKAMSTQNENPAVASRPFDVHRDGFVMGEGGGALILEELEHAKKRGATIYAEITGAAMTADAYHISATHPEGIGAAKGMELALKEAGKSPDQIQYINAHATSTPVGDLSEMAAIHKIFGNQSQLLVSATKSMTGHLLGGAGAIEAILCVKAINEGIVPPTINTEELDPEIPDSINIVTKKAISHKIDAALSNTFGFGGHNAIVLFVRFA